MFLPLITLFCSGSLLYVGLVEMVAEYFADESFHSHSGGLSILQKQYLDAEASSPHYVSLHDVSADDKAKV